MSVVGIDFGTQWCTLAVAQKGGIDIIPNEGSHLQDPYVTVSLFLIVACCTWNQMSLSFSLIFSISIMIVIKFLQIIVISFGFNVSSSTFQFSTSRSSTHWQTLDIYHRTILGFTEKQRAFGESAATQVRYVFALSTCLWRVAPCNSVVFSAILCRFNDYLRLLNVIFEIKMLFISIYEIWKTQSRV